MLQPCARCRRHVGSDETQCPFCRAPIVRAVPNAARVAGRLSRAAIFAGASACYVGQPAPQQPEPPRAETAPPRSSQDRAQQAPPPQAPPAQTSPPTTSTAPSIAATATIRGVVVDGRTNRPRPNVEVYLETAMNPIEARARSDANGAYVFSGLRPGDYRVSTRTSPPRQRRPRDKKDIEPEEPPITLKAGETQVENVRYYEYEPSPVKMPYGAPPSRTRLV